MLAISYALLRDSKEDESLGAVFPDLKSELMSISTVVIRTPLSEVKLHREDETWVLPDRGNFPASFDKLSAIVNGLADAKYVERKTNKPENFEKLGLRDLADKDSQAILVQIYTETGKEFQILFGLAATSRKGHYVRAVDSNQAWMIGDELDIRTDISDWLEKKIIDIDSDRVQRVIHTVAGVALEVARNADDQDGDFEVVNLPDGAKLRYSTIANELGRSLANVYMIDVEKMDEYDWSPENTAHYYCKDGLLITVHSRQQDDAYFLMFEFEQQAGSPSDALAAAVSDFRKKTSPWVYSVSEFTYKEFNKTLDQLIEKPK